MTALDLKPILARNATVDDGINAVRRMLPLCVFHSRCEASGIPAIEQYRREWDDDLKIFKANALHDWTSHAADALRYLAMSWQYAPKREIVQPRREGWVIPPPPEARRGMRL
jgi:phage terminase large subunit